MPGTLIIGRSSAMFEQQTLLMLNRAWGAAGFACGSSSPELRKLFQVPSLLGHEYTLTSLDLDLPLTVSPSMVSPTRRIIEAKLGPVLEDEDAIFRVAMTAHELLENAAKYASDGKARLELSVTPREEGAIVRVVVTNNATQEHIAELGTCYAEMNAAKDAMAHYFSLMRMNAKAGALSRLGLARVRAEGEMDIEVDVEGERVKIVASGIVAR